MKWEKKIELLKVSKKNYPYKSEISEGAFDNYISENDLKNLKTQFPDEWKHLNKKVAYHYE